MNRMFFYCHNCKHAFPSPFVGVGAARSSVIFEGSTHVCPLCKTTSSIPDGEYEFINDEWMISQGPAKSFQIFEKIKRLVETAQSNGESPDSVIASISEISPDLGNKFLIWFSSKSFADKTAFFTWIVTFLTFLMQVQQFYLKQEDKNISPSINEFNYYPTTINNTVNIIEKQNLNEPCKCGSGKKFKNCHGLVR